MQRLPLAWPIQAASLLYAALVFASPSTAQTKTAVLSPTQDTTIFESPTGQHANGSGNRGVYGTNANGNIRRYLTQFDIASAIPPGSSIVSATLELNLFNIAPGSNGNRTQHVHRLLQPWGEGASNSGSPGGMPAQAMTGDATWLHTFYQTIFWTTPGGDFAATPSSIEQHNTLGAAPFDGAGMTNDVQSWLDNPSNNFGWIVKDSTENPSSAMGFPSREHNFPSTAPKLTIEYNTNFDPATFCDPTNNSTGVPTEISGQLGTGVGSGLHLEATSGPPTQFGYFLIGSGVTEPGLIVGNGRLCLSVTGGHAIGRYNVAGGVMNSLGAFDSAGVLQNLSGTSVPGTGFDVPISVPVLPVAPILAGETWHFQLWHREALGQSNLSRGLSVTF